MTSRAETKLTAVIDHVTAEEIDVMLQALKAFRHEKVQE